MPTLKLFLLGPPRLEVDDRPIDIPRRKSVALLSYLAVNSEKKQWRDGLATLLWPTFDQSRARASLRSALWMLNKSPISKWLQADQETVGLSFEPTSPTQLNHTWLDVAHFRRLLAAAQSHNHPSSRVCLQCLNSLTEAVSLYRDNFMAGFTLPDSPNFDEWQFFQTETLQQELALALERLILLYSAQGNLKAAILHARHRLNLDPLYEPAHQSLIRLYASRPPLYANTNSVWIFSMRS
ncbi:MAG: BTAD domain-containing putative transcriptional regulator [Chloroflexota bacterium]